MTYSDKLKDPRWQRKRLDIMARDNFSCKHCGSTTETLHVHHKSYIYGNDPWNYADSNFITLCWQCHEIEESYKADVSAIIKQLLHAGFSNENLHFLLSNLIGYNGDFSIEDRIRFGSFCINTDALLNAAKITIEATEIDFLNNSTE